MRLPEVGSSAGDVLLSLQIMERDSTLAGMIECRLLPVLNQRLTEEPAVVLLGPCQAGKTTLALEVAARGDALVRLLSGAGR